VRFVCSRASTATQSLLRQRHILTEAGLLIRAEGVAEGFHPAEEVLLFEDPATTSKIPALERPAFGRIAATAHPGDTLTVSELFRLCRDLTDIHAVRDWCQNRGVVLRVLSKASPPPKHKAATAADHPHSLVTRSNRCGRRSETRAHRSPHSHARTPSAGPPSAPRSPACCPTRRSHPLDPHRIGRRR
jgi:hypothetical protein